MGRRTAASGIPAPAGGLVQRGCTPHFSFVLPKEKRAVHGPKRKNASAGRSAQAQTSCRRRGMVGTPLQKSGTETPGPWGNLWPGEVRDTSCAAFRCRSPGSSGKPGDLPVGAVINRPGDSAGVPAGQCAPHSLFGCAKKRTRRARCKRKRRFGRNFAHACKVAVRGSA